MTTIWPASISQAAQQISQLQSAYQQQAALITANTQALQGNTSAQSSHSAAGYGGKRGIGYSEGRRTAVAPDFRD